MPKLKDVGAQDLLSFFAKHGFEVFSQKGSHIKLKKITHLGKQILTIPNHKNIDKGTLKAIIRQASAFLSIEDLKEEFYTE